MPTPLWALGLDEIPSALHFRRDHHGIPDQVEDWQLELGGAVRRPRRLTMDALQRFEAAELDVVLECAGHRRIELRPKPPGVPWGTGAMSEARWRGVPLATLLRYVGLHDGAVEVVLEGADCGPFPDLPGEHCFARSLPVAKALHPDTLIAWEMNGEPIARERGGPLRAIVPGWYATDSIKWLAGIRAVTKPFTGPWQQRDYRFELPGEEGPGRRLTDLPVHALITHPLRGGAVRPGRVPIHGAAWGGEGDISRVELSVDGGPWQEAELSPSRGPYGRTLWRATPMLAAGRAVLAVRATDRSGRCQPEAPVWNCRGYANNSIHRVPMVVRERQRVAVPPPLPTSTSLPSGSL